MGDDRGFINNHDLMEEEEEQDENANRKEYSADIRGNMAVKLKLKKSVIENVAGYFV